MRVIAFVALLASGGCIGRDLSPSDTAEIRAEVETALRDAYDLSKPEPLPRMLALYPSSGRVVSANTGRVITSSDSVANGIREFWYYVGVNMRNPKWEWTNVYVDVLSRDAAVVTGTYRIPHLNPRNQPHVLGGAMTMVFKRQNGRWVVIQEHLSDTPQIVDSSSSMTTPNGH